jgi:hypothetical protein
MKKILSAAVVLVLLVLAPRPAEAQTRWGVGGHMGLSIASSTYGSSAGFHLGFVGEVVFNRSLCVGTEIPNINTQTGTPIEWATYFKYYFQVPGSTVKPYADGGFNLFFSTGGPYFGLRFGGGAGFLIAKNMYIGPDVQLGPVFTTGSTTFYIVIRGQFRYEIPG